MMPNKPFSTFYNTNVSSFINTTSETTTNETDLITFIKGTAGNSKALYVDTDFSYNPYLSTLTVPNISSSGTHYAGVVEATSGMGILNSAFLELNSSTLKRWLINCTADPTNNLQFSYYNGVFAVSYATLSVGGTFSTTNLSATTLVSAPTMTATGTITAATLKATSQIHAADTGVGLTANYTYITRGSAITYIGSVVSGTPTNQLTLDTLRAEFITGGGRYDQKDNAVANQQGICFFTSGILYQQNFVAGVLNNVYYGNHVNFAIVGNLYAASYSISCKNRKQNIEDLCPCYSADFISKLKPKKYQYKKLYDASGNETTRPDIDRKTSFGFLAQDVKEDICGCEDLGIHVEGDDDKFPQALSYIEIIAPLVKVVQDLMNTVKEQNERIKVLELKVNG